MNAASGNDEKAATRALILERLRDLGCQADVVEIAAGADVPACCEAAVRAAQKDNAIVVAAGGDGTLNAIATACHRHGAPLGIVPLGTFNYFARDLGIPLDPAAAAETLAHAPLRPVSAGMVDDRLFLVNASIGLYAEVIRNRENVKARFGRYRVVALAAAVASFFRRRRIFTVSIDVGGQTITRQTMMVFVCNNRFQLETLGLQRAGDIAPDKLCISILKPASRLQIARILFRGMLGAMGGESLVEEMVAGTFSIQTKRNHLRVVTDGEISRQQAPLDFRALPAALQVIAPQPQGGQNA